MTLEQLAAAAHQRERVAGRRRLSWREYPSLLKQSSAHHAAAVAIELAAYLREQGEERAAGMLEAIGGGAR